MRLSEIEDTIYKISKDEYFRCDILSVYRSLKKYDHDIKVESNKLTFESIKNEKEHTIKIKSGRDEKLEFYKVKDTYEFTIEGEAFRPFVNEVLYRQELDAILESLIFIKDNCLCALKHKNGGYIAYDISTKEEKHYFTPKSLYQIYAKEQPREIDDYLVYSEVI